MIRIDVTDNSFKINNTNFQFPGEIENLKQILGDSRITETKYNVIYTWDEYGLSAYSKNGIVAESLLICLKVEEYKFSSKKIFNGEITFNNEKAIHHFNNNKDKRVKLFKGDEGGAIILNGISFYFNVEDGINTTIEIRNYEKQFEKEAPTPLSLDENYKYLLPLWEEWMAETDKIISEDNDYFNLTHGITEEDIKKYSPLDEDTSIPEELINFYKIKNVEYNAVTSAFSFSANGWEYDLIPFKDIKEEWEGIQNLQFGDRIEENNLLEYSEKIKADGYANPKWIPFATGRNGDYLLYDTDPGDKGKYGQIIELQNESWERNVIAKSITELIQNEIDLLKKGQIKKYDFILGRK